MQSLKDLISQLQAQGIVPNTQWGKPRNKLRMYYKYGVRKTCTKPAIVYYIKLELCSGLTLYKIGHTSTSLRLRIAYMELPQGTKVTVLDTVKFTSATKAFHAEQLLHTYHSKHRYYGPKMLSSGNTELYYKPLE